MRFEDVSSSAEQQTETMPSSWVLKMVKDFAEGKKPFVDTYLMNDDFWALVKFLNIDEFDGERVLGYHVANTEAYADSGVHSDDVLDFGFKGKWRTEELIESLADTQGGSDFPNDFQVTFAVEYDLQTVVILGKRQEELALHCETCYEHMGEFDEFEMGISPEYSCSHMDGQYDYAASYWAAIVKRAEFEDRPDWHVWEVDGLATDHRIENKTGLVDGTLPLWELEIGDTVTVYAGEEQKQYRYNFHIKSAGIEPTVTMEQINPDGETVFLEDKSFILRGSGRWVGREWPLFKGNPYQKQLLVNYGNLSIGGTILLGDSSLPPREAQIYLMPQIHAIEVAKETLDEDIVEDIIV